VAFGAGHDCCLQGEAPAQVWRLSYGQFVDDPRDSEDEGTFLKRDKILKDRVKYDEGLYTWPNMSVSRRSTSTRGPREKAVLAYNEGKKGANDHIAVRLLSEPGDAQSLAVEASDDIGPGTDNNYDVSAIAGDVDKNSSWLTYQNQCTTYGVSTLSNVLNDPPIWYDYWESYGGIGAAFGKGLNNAVRTPRPPPTA